MTGIIYLRTDHFEVKLEGITFKVKDFESLCKVDFLFPDGKIWSRPPVVGIDIMRHPRDHNFILLLLCIGVGCVILRFRVGEILPNPILKFLADERIRFVGFALPKKSGLFLYDELGFLRKKVDIRYLAATRLNDSTYQKSELKELSRKVLGIKRMIGLTEASSFERHEHIKCAICQLFITTAIGIKLLGKKHNQKLDDSPKIKSFIKTLNSLPLLLSEGFLKFPKVKKDNNKSSRKIEIFKNAVGLEKRHNKESKVVDDIDINHKMRVKEGNFVDDIIDTNVISPKLNNDIIQLETTQVKKGFIVHDTDNSVKRKDDQLSNGFVLPKVTEGLSDRDGRLNGNFDLAKVINRIKDGVSLNNKGREKCSRDNARKGSSGTPKKSLQGLSDDNGLLGDNFGSVKVIDDIKDGVSLSIKRRENDSNDNSSKDTFETSKRQLEGLSGGDGFLDDNIDSVKTINFIKDGRSLSTNGRENYASDNSSKDTSGNSKTPLKGILKRSSSSRLDLLMEVPSPPPSFKDATTPNNQLRRANSKGLNVSFAFKL